MERTQLLYIGSRNRKRGTPADFHLQFEHGLLKADAPGTIEVTIMDIVIPRTWHNVHAGNCIFDVDDGMFSVPVYLRNGFYNAYTLRQELESALKNQVNPGWSVTYDAVTNAYTFGQPPEDLIASWAFVWYPAYTTHELLGFPTLDTVFSDHLTPIVSRLPLRLNGDSIYVHTNLPKVRHTVCDNILNTKLTESDILFKMPLTAAPNDTLVYIAQGSDLIKFQLSTPHISDLHVWLTDERGRVLDLPYDWTMTLKVDYSPFVPIDDLASAANLDLPHAIHASINDIKDCLRLLVMDKLSPGKT